MPTGYTSNIADGISFKKFIMDCARAFGALIEMRDDPKDAPIPEFKVSDYHEKHLLEAMEELDSLKKMDMKELNNATKADYDELLIDNMNYILKADNLRVKYDEMLSHVHAWIPPTEDHRELKKFMINQIESSIEHDCDTKYWKKNTPVLLSGEDWYHTKLKKFERDIKYHTDEGKKEAERVAGTNAWVKALRESLK